MRVFLQISVAFSLWICYRIFARQNFYMTKQKRNFIRMKSLKQQRIDQLVIGFALFSMFFGAGNIIFPPYLGMGSGNLWAGVSLLLPGRHRDRHSGDLCIDPKRRRDLYHNHTDRQSPRRDHAVCYHPLHRSLHRPSANRGYSSGNVHRTGIRRCVFMAYQRDLLSAGPAFDH